MTSDPSLGGTSSTSAKRIGRLAGVFFLLQMLAAPAIYSEFGVTASILSPQFLQLAAPNVATIRIALLPRWLAGAGVAATLLSTSAAVMSLLQHPFSYLMVAPTAVVQLVLVIWLLTRGFVGTPNESMPYARGS